MLGLFSDLFVVVLVIVALTAVCATWGRATFRLIGVEPAQTSFDCGTLWLGFATLLSVIEFLHLFVAIDWRVSACVFGTALLPLLTHAGRAQLIHHISACVLVVGQNRFKTLVTAVIALLWCLRAMGVPNNFDSGLYHFGSIRWMNEYPIVPGLGNLHWRLALNQSYFGYLSLVNIFPLWNKGYAVGGLFLLYLTSFTVLKLAASQPTIWRWLVGGPLFIFFGYLAGTLPNPSPDTAIGLLEIVIFCFLFQIIYHYQNNKTIKLRDVTVVLMLTLALITIKLSSVAFALTSMLLVVYLQLSIWCKKSESYNKQYSNYFKLCVLMLLISAIHIFRGLLLSGVPFFPSTFAGAWDLDWAVSIELVKFEANFIYTWARQPGEMLPKGILGSWAWLSIWLKTVPVLSLALFSLSTILMLINLYRALFKKTTNNIGSFLFLYLPLVVAFSFWFLTAPDIRFLGAVPTLYFVTSFWIFYDQLPIKHQPLCIRNCIRNRLVYYILAMAICLFSFKLMGLRAVSLQGWTSIPKYGVNIEKTLTELPIYVSSLNGQCWDAPLPCASIFNGNLHKNLINMPWPLSILDVKRFFYSVKFLNLSK